MQFAITGFMIGLTVAAYLLCRYLFLRYNKPYFNVVLLGAAIIIMVLLVLGLPYESYIPGKNIMTALLGPATVALAVPLYKNRMLLKQYGVSILIGISLGSLVSMLTAMLIARYGGLAPDIVVSIATKSVTIPFAIEIARIYGGEPSLAAAFVVATGTLGSVIGTTFLTWVSIRHPVARGLALGTVAHGQGVAMALLEGEQQGAMAGVAMGLAGVITSLLAPFILPLFL